MSIELNPGLNSVNDLVKRCRTKITGQRQIAGYICGPVTPIVFVTFGSCCQQQNIEIIKETIELAWNNIQGNLIILQYPESVTEDTLKNNLDESIAQLKSASEGIFSKYILTKVFAFVNSDDPNYDEYVKLLDGNLNTFFEQLQIVVAAKINEKTVEEKKAARKKLSCLMKLKKKKKIQGLLVLSNVLRNGRIIKDDAERDQYRIAANIAYLCNSRDMSTGIEDMISREICETLFQDDVATTTAYIRLSKPSSAIVRTTLRKIMDCHNEWEEEKLHSDGFDASHHGFRSKVTGQKEEGFFGIDKIFKNEVCKQLPQMITIDDFPYFQEVKEMKKNMPSSLSELESQMNSGTFGFWRLFVEYNYIKRTQKYIQDNERYLYQKMKQFLKEKISYKELLIYMQNSTTKEDILRDFENIAGKPMMGTEQDLNVMLYFIARNKAYKVFCQELGEICKRALLDYFEDVKRFNQVVQTTRQLLNIGFIPDLISSYYEDKAQELFENATYAERLNQPCDSVEQYCHILEDVFEHFVNEHSKVYMLAFEDELSARIDSNATGTIMDELGFKNKRLEDECRFEYGKIPEGTPYCIAFAQAKFIKNLEEQEQGMVKVFKTSRQESVERIMLCTFPCDDFILKEDVKC